ncbi:hypothetical protein N7520_003182 [Penicillium odoratum]|uniref:uncharacterized protein n=1 Tax=Penicillium odoratum TaxID=1167516 RepID=UPI0025488E74|nr:uncharacterized protein N7520_003182 [Penicillium odoratum]KAJ5772653.1 hypothetical protein N7520_003182 [Penicillium odoratum]
MTINHVFLWGSPAKFQSLRAFYRAVLQPVGYNEMIRVNDECLIGYGSDYPYFWLKQLPADKTTMPTHIAFDAPSRDAVDRFYELALQHGGRDNGAPGIREEMSRQPYYAAFILDLHGNNVEAVYVPK